MIVLFHSHILAHGISCTLFAQTGDIAVSWIYSCYLYHYLLFCFNIILLFRACIEYLFYSLFVSELVIDYRPFVIIGFIICLPCLVTWFMCELSPWQPWYHSPCLTTKITLMSSNENFIKFLWHTAKTTAQFFYRETIKVKSYWFQTL